MTDTQENNKRIAKTLKEITYMETKNITLSKDAIRDIQMLREYEREGGCHEKIFLEVLSIVSSYLWERGGNEDKEFRDYFENLTYFSNILTSLVKVK